MHPGVPTRVEDWNLALPVEAQEGAPAVVQARRRARRVIAVAAGLVMLASLPIAAVVWRESQSTECAHLAIQQGFRGALPAQWSSWPPGWECVLETRDGAIATRYIGL